MPFEPSLPMVQVAHEKLRGLVQTKTVNTCSKTYKVPSKILTNMGEKEYDLIYGVLFQ